MADRHINQGLFWRPPRDLRTRFLDAVRSDGRALTGVLNGFLRWYVGDIDDPPARPPHATSRNGSPSS